MILGTLFVIVLVLLDQLIKYFVCTYLHPVGSTVIIPKFLEFRYLENSGAAFGIMNNNSIFFAVITIVVSIVIIISLFKYKGHTKFSKIACLMVVAGGIGNLIDRVRLNYVVDFIYFYIFPYVFNFADCLVVIGVAFLFIFLFFGVADKKDSEDVKK